MTRNFTRIVMALLCLLGYTQVHAQSRNVYDNVPASVVWAFNSPSSIDAYTSEPEKGFSLISFNDNGATVNGTGERTHEEDPAVDANGNNVVFLKFKPVKGATDVLTWSVKPAKGLTFTPTRVSGWIQRFATDSENGVTVTMTNAEGKSAKLGTYTALRANKGHDHKTYDANAVNKFDIELTPAQQAELASTGEISLSASIGVGNTKEGGFSDIHIEGLLNGTKADVVKYTLSVGQNMAEAGKVEVLPSVSEYEQGTEVKLSALKNFGYAFVNWTDEAGKVVSTEPVFTYTVDAAAKLTANFKAINTYELAYAVEGGANPYQVSVNPAGTMVDGRLMYEEGSVVTLSALSNPIVTFTNWGDGQSSSEITVRMDADHTDIVANFDAKDFIAGWDFYQSGNDGRAADFFAAENDAVALVMRNAAGETSGWLDKSQAAAGGYEGRPAAVNWRTTGLGEYYWQTKVNASAFTDIKVITAMTFNFNAYSKQNVEYSLDGETWKPVGTITLTGAKAWVDADYTLPAEANNQPELFIRWISDKSSEIKGTTSQNDGVALGATYITGTAKLVDDGTAPVLVSYVPEEGAANASINGKIVLTFDEKVKVKDGAVATLGGMQLIPSVTGKTVMFDYKNLIYATDYKFTLAAGSIMDLTDNAIDKEIIINFTTKSRPEVAKCAYDVEVSTVDELVAAIKAAETRDDMTARFRIFLHNGTYKLPASTTAVKTGDPDKNDQNSQYPDPTTYITAPNISFIGESREGVIVTNTLVDKFIDTKYGHQHVLEGIGRGDVLELTKTATGTYFQNLTLKSAMGDAAGRDIVLNDKSDKTICKDVCLWAYQDTYVSNNENSRFYFEGGLLRGRTDFLCGKGDVYYNAVTLQMCADGGYLAVPSKPKKYGYVFKDCEITGEKSGIDGKFTLGRPWGKGTPIALFIDTKMSVKPSAAGWNEMSGGWPARFAEYNSTTASGTVIDLKDRKKSFGDKDKDGVFTNNPVLTKEEADFHSYARVMGGDDDWDPASLTEQAPAPTNVTFDGNTLSWDDSKYALLWAVCKDGEIIAFTTEPSYTIAAGRAAAVYSVRAANEMGGLGEAVEASEKSAITDINADAEVVSTVYYNLQGMRVAAGTPGVLVKVDTLASGRTVTTKVVF